jgi:ABC-type transporter Mla subunit MlaD
MRTTNRTNRRALHLRLGIFALAVLGGLIAMVLMLGSQQLRRKTIAYVSYFDESVQGLDLGAPVKFRGVAIGSVSAIKVAKDGHNVEVTLDIDKSDAKLLEQERSRLRAQLASQGITGVRLVDISIVDPARHPAPELTFTPGPRYIPSRVSLVGGLESSVEDLQRRLPELVDQFQDVMAKLERGLDRIEEEHIIPKLGDAIANAQVTMRSLRGFMQQLETANLPARTSSVLANLDAATVRARRLFESVNGATSSSSSELRATLRDLSDAARSVRELANEIERAPDMLVKGRPRSRR